MFLPRSRIVLSLTALVAAVVLTLLWCAPVYAQAEEPPAAPAETEAVLEEPADELPLPQPPEAAGGDLESPLPEADSPQDGEEAPAEAVLDEPADELETPAPDEAEPQDGLDVLLDDLVVVDGGGEVIPLDEEAEELAAADPWFRSGGVVYNFTALDCDPGTPGNQACSNPIQAAVTYVRDKRLIPDDLTIHVETGTFAEDVSIDGDTAANPNNVNLQYVRYLTGAGSDPLTGTVLNGKIDIRNLLYGFTLSGFYIQGNGTETAPLVYIDSYGAVTVTDVALVGGGQEGMVITRKAGAVTLANVEARDNKGSGVEIGEFTDLDGGGIQFTPISGPVSVSNSVFNHNATANTDGSKWRAGLSISTNSIVTINGVTASGNLGGGVDVFRGVNVTVKNSAMLNNSKGNGLWVSNLVTGYNTIENVIANGNHQRGMYLQPNGELVLRNVQASGNGMDGVNADPCSSYWDAAAGKWLCHNTTPGSVSVYNGVFNNNGPHSPGSTSSGLNIFTRGAILAADIEANGNDNFGIYLGNFVGNNSPVTLLRTARGNETSDNGYVGAVIVTLGAVTVQNLTAANNGAVGLSIDSADSYQPVLVYDYSTFTGNGTQGIKVITKGSITLRNTYAYGNGAGGASDYGAYLNNHAASLPSYAGVLLYDTDFSGNNGNGLRVESDGAITLYDVSVNDNALSGAVLKNDTGYSGVSLFPVGLVNTNNFNDNGLTGLRIETKGTVFLQRVRASRNGKSPTEPGDGAVILTAPGYGGVTLLEASFSDNDGFGLWVNAGGAIVWTTGSANRNTYSPGAYLKNDTVLPAAVTLTSVKAYDNAGDGFQIISKGFVTILGSLDASRNGGDGYKINNTGGYGVTLVTTDGFGSDNAGYSIQVLSGGAISLTGLTAWGNGLGCLLDNTGGAGGVTLVNTTCQANAVGSTNLKVLSKGLITLVNVSANDNQQGNGVLLDNTAAPYPVGVTVITGDFSRNKGDGLRIQSKGFVTLLYVSSGDNKEGDGIYVDNTSGYGVSVLNNQQYNNDNAGYSLRVLSGGAISLTGLSAWNNGQGCRLDNTSGAGGVTLVNTICQANAVGSTNLTVLSKGLITLVNVDARDNRQGNGVLLDNSSALYPVGVTVSSGRFWYNKGSGLRIQSKGFVSLLHVASWGNQGDGIYIDNTGGSGVSILNNSQLQNEHNNDNQGYGLFIQTNGAVTVNSTNFWRNLKGNWIDNTGGSAGVTLLYSGFDSSDNSPAFFPGLTINTNGAVYLLNVETGSSADGGAIINNASSPYNAGVTIVSSYFDFTGGRGLEINSRGFVTLSQITASGNAWDGVYINNIGGYGVSIVNTSGSCWWNANQGWTAYIESSGAVTVSSVNGSGSRKGIYVDNSYSASAPVTLFDLFLNPGETGIPALQVRSNGYITLTNFTIQDSQGAGAVLDNAGSAYKYGMTVSGGTFKNNNGEGLKINSLGAVTVLNVISSRNKGISGYGFYLSNTGNTLPVTILNSVFNNNSQDGIYIDTKGVISILNGEANSNGGQGIQAMNDLASFAMPVVITNFRTNLNAYQGIIVLSKGAITLTSVTSLANGMTTDAAGALLASSGGPVYVYYSAFNGNGKQGLHVDTRGGAGAGAVVNVLNTYTGNDVFGGVKDVNLLWQH